MTTKVQCIMYNDGTKEEWLSSKESAPAPLELKKKKKKKNNNTRKSFPHDRFTRYCVNRESYRNFTDQQ